MKNNDDRFNWPSVILSIEEEIEHNPIIFNEDCPKRIQMEVNFFFHNLRWITLEKKSNQELHIAYSDDFIYSPPSEEKIIVALQEIFLRLWNKKFEIRLIPISEVLENLC